jgi:hypothetical protein
MRAQIELAPEGDTLSDEWVTTAETVEWADALAQSLVDAGYEVARGKGDGDVDDDGAPVIYEDLNVTDLEGYYLSVAVLPDGAYIDLDGGFEVDTPDQVQRAADAVLHILTTLDGDYGWVPCHGADERADILAQRDYMIETLGR